MYLYIVILQNVRLVEKLFFLVSSRGSNDTVEVVMKGRSLKTLAATMIEHLRIYSDVLSVSFLDCEHLILC